MHAIRFAAAAMFLGLASHGASAACYVVYSSGDQVLYRSTQSPVDLSYQLHQTMPLLVPGGKLVFTLDNTGCETEVNVLPVAAPAMGPRGGRPGMRPARADRG